MVGASDEKMRRPSLLNVGTIIFLVVMIVGGVWLRPVLATRNLNSLVASANSDLPKMLDADTRLDQLSSSSEGVVYHLTVMSDVEFTQAQSSLEARTRTTYCDRMDGLVSDGFSAEWRYSSQDEQVIGSVSHQPADCR